MELLYKPIVTLNYNDIDISLSLSISNNIPANALNNEIFTKLNKYKSMIDTVTNIKFGIIVKKLSNEYELLHHCIKHKNSNLGIANYDPISRLFFKSGKYVMISIL